MLLYYSVQTKVENCTQPKRKKSELDTELNDDTI